MNTFLSKRGYSVLKDELTSTEISSIRKDLSVKPFVNSDYGVAPSAFPIYCESKRKLYLPRLLNVSITKNIRKLIINILNKPTEIFKLLLIFTNSKNGPYPLYSFGQVKLVQFKTLNT